MDEQLFFQITLIAVASVGAQWLAWRLHVPAILFLLAFGFILGPGMGLLLPDLLMGDLLRPAISAAVAIILFEGALHLRFKALKESSPAVRQIIFVGAPLGWYLISAGGHYVGGLSWPVAIVLGGMLVVTGPTVIMPLLRQARLNPKVGSVLKWEGIVNDPVGIIFAILAYEYFHALSRGPVQPTFFYEKAAIIMLVSAISVLSGYAIRYLFAHGHMPEYLKAPFVLSVVLGLFFMCNGMLHESGLIAVTVLGITLANIHTASLEEIHRFKETITILLVSGVFLLLTASLDMNALMNISWRGVLFIVVLLVFIRPLTVALSSIGAKLNWREILLIGWIAPRGVVCAAMAGVLAPLLMQSGFSDAHRIIPIAFGVVLSSVILHSLTIRPLAKRLRLQTEESDGVLISGAHDWSVQLCVLLKSKNIPVMLADNNFNALKKARMEGIPLYYGELLGEETEYTLEFNRFNTLIAATYSPPYNALLCDKFAYDFGRERVFQIQMGDERAERKKLSNEIMGTAWADQTFTLEWLQKSFAEGWRFRLVRVGKADKDAALIVPAEGEFRKIAGYISTTGVPHLKGARVSYKPRENDQVLVYELEGSVQDKQA